MVENPNDKPVYLTHISLESLNENEGLKDFSLGIPVDPSPQSFKMAATRAQKRRLSDPTQQGDHSV